MSLEDDEKDRLELALKASNEGVWDWDLDTNELYYSNRLLRFMGFGRVGAPNIFEAAEEYVHPKDWEEWRRQMNALDQGEADLFAMEARLKTADESWKWFRVRAVPRRHETGRVYRIVGSLIDISKRMKAKAELEEERSRIALLLESVPANVYLKDKESRFLRANGATARRMGADSVEDLLGKTDHDFFGSEHADEARAVELRIMETRIGQIDEMEHEVWEDGHETWVMVTKMPWVGLDGQVKGTFGVTNEVTELVEAQNQLAEINADLEAANKVIEEERHRLRLVIDNIPMFVYFKDLESKFVLVNQGMADLFGLKDPRELVGKRDRDFFFRDFYEMTEADEMKIMETGEPLPTKLEKLSWREGDQGWAMSTKFPWRDREGKVVGTYGVSGDVTEIVKTRDRLTEIAAALARKNEAMEEELKLAREVQQAAIPRFLPITSERMRFSHYYLPASDLAGDFFEVLPLGPEKAAFLVCDVMGLGVRAALIVSMLRGLLEKGQEKRESPGKFLEGLNAGLCHLLERTGITIFATALYGVVDLGKGMITIASAGHPDPLLKRKNGVSSLDFEGGSKGPALGLVAGASFGEVVISVNEVVALWCFTDGIYEVRDAAGNELGERGLTSRLEKDSTLEGLIRYAREFAAEGQFDDDVCLLGLELS